MRTSRCASLCDTTYLRRILLVWMENLSMWESKRSETTGLQVTEKCIRFIEWLLFIEAWHAHYGSWAQQSLCWTENKINDKNAVSCSTRQFYSYNSSYAYVFCYFSNHPQYIGNVVNIISSSNMDTIQSNMDTIHSSMDCGLQPNCQAYCRKRCWALQKLISVELCTNCADFLFFSGCFRPVHECQWPVWLADNLHFTYAF